MNMNMVAWHSSDISYHPITFLLISLLNIKLPLFPPTPAEFPLLRMLKNLERIVY
jgi:hypothetical protein